MTTGGFIDVVLDAVVTVFQSRRPPAFCVRGSKAIQFHVGKTFSRPIHDLDLYAFLEPGAWDCLFLKACTGACPPFCASPVVVAHDFIHPTLTLPIREYALSWQDGKNSLVCQVTFPPTRPEVVQVAAMGTSVSVLAIPELVAEKLLKFTTHSQHVHASRQRAAHAKHLGDLCLLLPYAEQIEVSEHLHAIERVLLHEQRNGEASIGVKGFVIDAQSTIAQYANGLASVSNEATTSPGTGGPSSPYSPSSTCMAVSRCLEWMNHLAGAVAE
jgi:hypothetical protein